MRHAAIQDRSIGALIPRLLGVAFFMAIPLALLFAALAPDAHVQAVAEGGIACPFRALTTLPCPFCNMTHATLALGQGHVALSLAYHPLGLVVLALWMWACLELARGARSDTSRRIMTPAIIGVVVAIIWAGNLINHYLRV
jgi:hypothetical protein